MLIIMGLQFAKHSRYLLSATPFIVMFGAYFLAQFIDGKVILRADNAKKVRIGIALVLILASVFWALAFTQIYLNRHPHDVASEWIYSNIPENSTISSEHWDNSLPFHPPAGRFNLETLALYENDDDKKIEKLAEQLGRIDYVIITSNRLYGSIQRLPDLYPFTGRYYELLFNGSLGFTLNKTFTNYPSLFGIEINDDSAYESFTAYDHPKVLIFKNMRQLNSTEIVRLIKSSDAI
jgi:hypothetical protein